MLTCSIMWQAWIQTLIKFSFHQPTKRIMIDMVSREYFMLEHSMHGNFLLIIRENFISRKFYFSFPPTTHFLSHKLDISTGENIVQLSLPKVQPATEQSIMMDMYRGVASIAFCLQFYCYKYFIFL